MEADTIRIERVITDSKLFAHTRWDFIPATMGILHCAYFFLLFYLFPRTSLWIMIPLGFLYSISISWNINGISHNFIHNPYFRAPLLNRLFSLMESISCCFSQTYYDVVHMQHHKGNSDRKDEHGDTIDWLSIYRHGHEGEAENAWSYTFLSFFRDNPAAIRRELVKRGPTELRWGKYRTRDHHHRHASSDDPELAIYHFLFPAVLLFRSLPELLERLLPPLRRESRQTYRVGREQLRQDLQLGLVLQRLPRRTSFPSKSALDENGAFHQQIAELQRQEGVRVIKPPHALGFLDPDLPKRGRPGQTTEAIL